MSKEEFDCYYEPLSDRKSIFLGDLQKNFGRNEPISDVRYALESPFMCDQDRLGPSSRRRCSTCHNSGNTGGWPGAYPPGVQRTSSATSASKFGSIVGWMGSEESLHCPFDVI